MTIYRIPEEHIFHPVSEAEPNGLLGVGGDLAPTRLLKSISKWDFSMVQSKPTDSMVRSRSQICTVST